MASWGVFLEVGTPAVSIHSEPQLEFLWMIAASWSLFVLLKASLKSLIGRQTRWSGHQGIGFISESRSIVIEVLGIPIYLTNSPQFFFVGNYEKAT